MIGFVAGSFEFQDYSAGVFFFGKKFSEKI